MAKLPWFKLYIEIMDDPKLSGFTGDQFRVLIYLMCLARESDEPGLIKMTLTEIAWRVRRPIEEVESTIKLCQQGSKPIIQLVDDGMVLVKFLDRQYDKPSDAPQATRERKQKQRDKDKSHADVTPSHAIEESRGDKDQDKDKDQKKNKPPTPLPVKTKHAEFVSLTNDEYTSLVARLGSEDRVKRCIEILDNYKGAKGKTYKSDYRAILNWVIERLEEEEQKKGGQARANHGSGDRPTVSKNVYKSKRYAGLIDESPETDLPEVQ